MMTVRQLHTYVGAFIAPSVLFFAFTGSLQIFGLHEHHGDYTPPPIIEMFGRIHKDQVTKAKPRPVAHAPHAADHDATDHDSDHQEADHHDSDHHDAGDTHADANHHDHAAGATAPWAVTALKWLFLAVAVGLTASTVMGLWLALTASRRKGLVLGLVVLGAALPVILLALQP
jgi:ABC-type nickel/cobalt efflux system permease component RcnA